MSNIRGSSDGKHCPRRYTPGDRDEGWIYRSGIDVHRIHSGDDMDKCKIYRGGGSVRIYSGKKRDELALSLQRENPCRVVKTDSSTHADSQHFLGWWRKGGRRRIEVSKV